MAQNGRRARSLLLWTFLLSYSACLASKFFGSQDLTFGLALPALVISGWAALGHLVTLDDDRPGGWSNPQEDKAFWHSSLRELSLKFIVFLSLLLVLAWD